jgi:hypothetical protein
VRRAAGAAVRRCAQPASGAAATRS